jgi:hypothetical protein
MLPVRNIMGLGAKVVRSTADDLARAGRNASSGAGAVDDVTRFTRTTGAIDDITRLVGKAKAAPAPRAAVTASDDASRAAKPATGRVARALDTTFDAADTPVPSRVVAHVDDVDDRLARIARGGADDADDQLARLARGSADDALDDDLARLRRAARRADAPDARPAARSVDDTLDAARADATAAAKAAETKAARSKDAATRLEEERFWKAETERLDGIKRQERTRLEAVRVAKQLEEARLERAYARAMHVAKSVEATWSRRIMAAMGDPDMQRRAELGGFFDGLMAGRAASAVGTLL